MNHLVLDLDETLVHSEVVGAAERQRMGRAADYDIGDMQGFYRPGLKRFLAWAFDTFASVGVWTAGSADYADSIVDVVFTQQGLPRPEFVLSADDCVARLENIAWHRYAKTQYKPLAKLWKRYPALNERNTLVLDDRTDTACENTPNLLLVPAFALYAPHATRDDYLYKLERWIERSGLATRSDVRTLDKSTWWLEGGA